MHRFSNPLDNVHVASPCNVDWDQMTGNERARFCGQCNLNVYNLSSMSRAEAEYLIANNEGRLCVRYFRRKDGSILTKDCPVGLRAIKRRLSYISRAVASAVITFLAGIGIFELTQIEIKRRNQVMGVMAVREYPQLETMGPPTVGTFVTEPVMGGVQEPPRRKRR
ncbi:MAG TPA: hypothetical protein VN643_00440 [Pyrinomonadaceae bacterium]|nr:hypothetical protein [Pyrinomonadaceae bacterium]